MKKGFTLVELIAIITLLGLIIVIVVPVTNYIIDKREKDAFKVSVYGLLTAVDEEYASNGKTFPVGGLNAKNIDIDINNKEQFTKGKITYRDNTYYADRISNGKYCVSGTRNDLKIVGCSIHLVDEDLYLDYSFACPTKGKGECGYEDYEGSYNLISVTFGYDDDTPSEYYYSYDVGSKPGMITAYLVRSGNVYDGFVCPPNAVCPGPPPEIPAFDLYVISDYKIFAPGDSEKLFYNFSNVRKYEFNNFDTSKVYDMAWMFEDNYSLETLDLSSFDTSNVESMVGMFDDCYDLETLDLSNFDTSNVTDMGSMFKCCESLKNLNISSFDTSNVENMSYMFEECYSLKTLDLSNFNTSNVTNMNGMFEYCGSLKNLNISSFDTSNVEGMSSMFEDCNSLETLDLSNFDTSNVITMANMFSIYEEIDVSSTLDLNLSNFNTSNVANMDSMFERRNVRNLNISNFDFSNVKNISSMFEGNPYLNTSFTMNFSATGKVAYNNFLKNAAQYGQVNIRLDCTNYNPANIENVLATATYSNKIRVTEVSCPVKNTITVSDSTVTPSLSRAYPGTKITLKASPKEVSSFKMNGTLINGKTFTMPSVNANVTDIELISQIYVESEHNPYANSINNVVYYENTFEGATSINVTINYATEGCCDYVLIYDKSGTSKKYGGCGTNQSKLSATTTLSGNYIKIVFYTDGSVNGYYGFDATIEPVIPST